MWALFDGGNSNLAVLLAVTNFFVHTFFTLVANDAELFALDHWFFYLSGNCYARDSWRTHGGILTIHDEERLSLELFCAFREEVHQEGLFFGYKVLLAAYFNDCFLCHSILLLSYQLPIIAHSGGGRKEHDAKGRDTRPPLLLANPDLNHVAKLAFYLNIYT